MGISRWVPGLICFLAAGTPLMGQAPSGLAARLLGRADFAWARGDGDRLRVYFLPDTYPARHADSLMARLPGARRHAEALLRLPRGADTLDVFFVESRPQMESLLGLRATGFADPQGRTVLLMTNPGWRGFERHEIMHVIAGQTFGTPAPGTDWLVEGLAQFADGRCAGVRNTDALLALTAKRGWYPLIDVLEHFRQMDDLRAYLQAAGLVEFLYARLGPEAVGTLWRRSASPDTRVHDTTLYALERDWRRALTPVQRLSADRVTRLEAKGCG